MAFDCNSNTTSSLSSKRRDLLEMKAGHFPCLDSYFMTRFGPTQLIQYGLKELATHRDRQPFNSVNRIILIIPGNPGSIELYRHLMQQLYEECNIPVLGLSHPGMIREGITRFKGPLTIRKIVEQKLEFIESFIPSNVEIVLVSHSIGTFIATQMMRCIRDRNRFVHNVMLMPVLEKFTSLPGWNTVRVLQMIRYVIYGLVFILSFLRDDILISLFPRLLSGFTRNTPICVYSGVLQLVNWKVMRSILGLTRDEAAQVQERDDLFLSHNLSKMTFVYCLEDHWAPLKFYRSLKKKFPEGHFVILDSVEHAFTMDVNQTSDVVATISRKVNSLPLNRQQHPAIAMTGNGEPNLDRGLSPSLSSSSWSEPSNP